jgi:hypothetical protein
MFPDAGDGPVAVIVLTEEFESCQAPAHDCGLASTVDALQTKGVYRIRGDVIGIERFRDC